MAVNTCTCPTLIQVIICVTHFSHLYLLAPCSRSTLIKAWNASLTDEASATSSDKSMKLSMVSLFALQFEQVTLDLSFPPKILDKNVVSFCCSVFAGGDMFTAAEVCIASRKKRRNSCASSCLPTRMPLAKADSQKGKCQLRAGIEVSARKDPLDSLFTMLLGDMAELRCVLKQSLMCFCIAQRRQNLLACVSLPVHRGGDEEISRDAHPQFSS